MSPVFLPRTRAPGYGLVPRWRTGTGDRETKRFVSRFAGRGPLEVPRVRREGEVRGRPLTGGVFNNNDNDLHASNRNSNPTNENNNIGFRVSQAPESPPRRMANEGNPRRRIAFTQKAVTKPRNP